MATTPIGTLTKKIHRQPMPLVMAPPTSGPTATAPPITAPKIPKACPVPPLERLGDQGERGGEHDGPTHTLTARDRFSINEAVDSPQTSEASENTPRPMAKTSRRPNMSPTTRR